MEPAFSAHLRVLSASPRRNKTRPGEGAGLDPVKKSLHRRGCPASLSRLATPDEPTRRLSSGVFHTRVLRRWELVYRLGVTVSRSQRVQSGTMRHHFATPRWCKHVVRR